MAILALVAGAGGQHLQHQPGETKSNPGESRVSKLVRRSIKKTASVAGLDFLTMSSTAFCDSGQPLEVTCSNGLLSSEESQTLISGTEILRLETLGSSERDGNTYNESIVVYGMHEIKARAG